MNLTEFFRKCPEAAPGPGLTGVERGGVRRAMRKQETGSPSLELTEGMGKDWRSCFLVCFRSQQSTSGSVSWGGVVEVGEDGVGGGGMRVRGVGDDLGGDRRVW